MKLAIRIFAAALVIAGLTAASVSSATAKATPSHLSATTLGTPAKMAPIPLCGPGMGCPPPPPPQL